jgi:hypothetical protein
VVAIQARPSISDKIMSSDPILVVNKFRRTACVTVRYRPDTNEVVICIKSGAQTHTYAPLNLDADCSEPVPGLRPSMLKVILSKARSARRRHNENPLPIRVSHAEERAFRPLGGGPVKSTYPHAPA